MSELEKKKSNIINELRGLCAHCANVNTRAHVCPVKELAIRVQHLRGVPLVVNSQFKGMLWA